MPSNPPDDPLQTPVQFVRGVGPARADLLALDGDPLADIGVLQDPDRRLRLIVKGGTIYKDAL